jgi:hypothetical protein
MMILCPELITIKYVENHIGGFTNVDPGDDLNVD